MNQNRRHLPEDGFTLVEILVTIIVGAIIVGSINVFVVAQGSISQRNRDDILANSYIEGKVEALRSMGFLGLSDGTTSIAGELPSELKAPRGGTVQVSSVNTAIKKVDITINYNNQGDDRSLSYTTYIGELGVGQY